MVTRRDVWVGMLLYPRHTLPTAAAPVLVAVGLAVHRHVLSVPAAVAAFLTGWFVQLGGVFTDNYKNLALHPDDEEHADFVEAVRGGVVSLSEIRLAIYATYALALLVGLFLLWIGGLPALVVGLLAIAASLAYSAGPYPLGDHALGDPLFFVFFGLVSVAGQYLKNGDISYIQFWDPAVAGYAMNTLAVMALAKQRAEIKAGLDLGLTGYTNLTTPNAARPNLLYGAGWVGVTKDNMNQYNF